MSQTLINTLRFADRLKEAGFAGPQAEALARVLGDELTEQLPSKADFQTLQADFKVLEAKFDGLEAKFNDLEGKFDTLERQFRRLRGEVRYSGETFRRLRGEVRCVRGQVRRFALHAEPRAGSGRAARGARAHRAALEAVRFLKPHLVFSAFPHPSRWIEFKTRRRDNAR